MRFTIYYPVNSLQYFCFKIDAIIMMHRTSLELGTMTSVASIHQNIFTDPGGWIIPGTQMKDVSLLLHFSYADYYICGVYEQP